MCEWMVFFFRVPMRPRRCAADLSGGVAPASTPRQLGSTPCSPEILDAGERDRRMKHTHTHGGTPTSIDLTLASGEKNLNWLCQSLHLQVLLHPGQEPDPSFNHTGVIWS